MRVRAQVMSRDEVAEGWMPLQGGAMANVSIRRRARLPEDEGHEYVIYGQRLSDQMVKFPRESLEISLRIARISGHFELRHKSRSYVQQSHANIPPLAGWIATERSRISNGS